jgi:hypothetical protein
MQTQKLSRGFEVRPIGLMLFLVLGSAMVGAVGGYALRASASSAPAAAESNPVAAVSQPAARINAVPAVKAYPFADENELRQEQRDMREAQKGNAAVRSASAAPVQIDLWQEHLDLLQMQGAQRSAIDESSVNTPAPTTATERYQALKARQIEQLEILP